MKLLIDLFSEDYLFNSFPYKVPDEKLEELEGLKVGAVVFVYSGERPSYLGEFKKQYGLKNFHVESLRIENLSYEYFQILRDLSEKLYSLGHEINCLMISDNNINLCNIVGACLMIYNKGNPEKILARINSRRENKLESPEELSFVYSFKKFVEPGYIIPGGISSIIPLPEDAEPSGDETIFKPEEETPDSVSSGEDNADIEGGVLSAESSMDTEIDPEKESVEGMGEDTELNAGEQELLDYIDEHEDINEVEDTDEHENATEHEDIESGTDKAGIMTDEQDKAKEWESQDELEVGPGMDAMPSDDISSNDKDNVFFDRESREQETDREAGAEDEVPSTKYEEVKPFNESKPSGRKKSSAGKSGILGRIRPENFKPTIRSKLISIISLIIIVSISLIIFLATYFFRTDNEARVIESNHRIAAIISLNIKKELSSIVEKSSLMATTMLQEFKSEEQEKVFRKIFFKNDRDFLYISIAVPSGGGGELRKKILNETVMAENQISEDLLDKCNELNRKNFSRAINGEAVVFNSSQVFRVPVMGLALPFQRDEDRRVNSILIVYVKLDNFLQAFMSTGITETFMINDSGDVIAHPDSKIVLSNSNYLNLPIVKLMKKSRLNNGQTRYADENGSYHLGSFKRIDFAGIGVIATVKEDEAFEEVYNIQRRNIFIMIIVLNLAIFIVYFFGKSLTTPILMLLKATKEIEKGNFNVNIMPTTRDEIGDLTSSFISMGRGLEEREKMKDAFGKFVNKEIAEQVLKGELKLGGERKDAAVFFSDIRSFTEMSEKLEPEEVVEILNDYMTRMVKCINETNGVVDKYIGDAIMAIWGAPFSTGNDTENAINSALMMRKSLIEFNKGNGGAKRPVIRIGIGINSGPVLAGQIGSEERMEYTVIGDTVNLASRVESLNKPFGTDILISEDSYEQVKDIYVVEKMDKIRVKGKEELQQIYAVLGRADDPDAPGSIEELRKLTGHVPQPFKRRKDDREYKEVKYEIPEK